MPVHSEEWMIGLKSAGANEDFDEIARLASKSGNLWIKVVPLGSLEGVLPRLLKEDLG